MEGKVYCDITPQAISMTGNIVDAESERYQTKTKQFNNTAKVGTLSYLGSIYHGCPLTYQAYLKFVLNYLFARSTDREFSVFCQCPQGTGIASIKVCKIWQLEFGT